MTQNRWGGVLQPKSTKGVVEEFRKSLAAKMARVESAEALKRFRKDMEEITTLQRLVYKQIVEVE